MYGSMADAITAAYEAHAGELHRFATAKVRDPEAAEDIVHEAYLRLAIECKAGRLPDNARAWLYRVAGNEIISRGRRATTAARHASTQLPPQTDDESPESRYLSVESATRLNSALRLASPRGRRGLVLAAEGYSGREIARDLGRSEVATRALLHRARRAVRRHLAADDAAYGSARHASGPAPAMSSCG